MVSLGPVINYKLPPHELAPMFSTYWIHFKEYLSSNLYTIIINGYNYSGRTIDDQISKDALIANVIEYLADKTYVIGHGACLESLYYNISGHLQKYGNKTALDLDKLKFVEAPKVGPIYISAGCLNEMNHNNNCCSKCVYINMCKTIYAQTKIPQNDLIIVEEDTLSSSSHLD